MFILSVVSIFFNPIRSFDVKAALEGAGEGDVIVIPPGIHSMPSTYFGNKRNVQVIGETGSVLECGFLPIILFQVSWVGENDYWYTNEFTHNSCASNNIYASIGQKIFNVNRDRGSLYKRNLLWVYKNLVDFQGRLSGDGVFFDTSTSRLYVAIENGMSPDNLRNSFRVLYVGCGRCLQIADCENIHFENFVIENGGNQLVFVERTNGVVFRKVEFLGGMEQIKFKGAGVSNTLIDNCKIMNYYNLDWVWGHVKLDPEYELLMGPALLRYQGVGGGHEIKDSDISGNFDGVQFWGSGTSCSADIDLGVKIHGNRVHNILDDAIEIEGGCNINVEVYQNVVYNVFSAVALAPCFPGPAYVYENLLFANLVIDFQAFGSDMFSPKVFKMSCSCDGNPPQNVKIYHNTIINKYGQMYHGNYPPGDQIRNFEVVNNIFYHIFNADQAYDCDQYLNHHGGNCGDGNFYDSNIYYVEGWDDTYYPNNLFHLFNGYSGNSLSEFVASSHGTECGWEQNGMTADPLIVMDDWDYPQRYELAEDSPAVGSAIDLDPSWPKDEYLLTSGNDIGVNYNKFEVYGMATFSTGLDCEDDTEVDEGSEDSPLTTGAFAGTVGAVGSIAVLEAVIILLLLVVIVVLCLRSRLVSQKGGECKESELE